ncbi:hypothetical protein AOQ84DRAFT_391596 [Glonium stellatum]|uniref:Carboxymuconolactone decarboxylase-like domain-containing protein n=1 Tax=Glonium stellatum TaxID=574774 RepID=A0A8E2ETF4_9PEZI|nr:hypothetical protein AOQ84DRAFT_391596 [Glonium stellatum]
MPRFPPIPPSEQTPEQKLGHEEMDLLTQQTFGSNSSFRLKNSEGALLGPFATLLYTPTLISPWLNITHRVFTLPVLSVREKELAIFAVLSHSRAAYALYAHTRLAEDAGLSPTQVTDAREGKLPQGLSEREEAAYVLVGELIRMRGPLDDGAFERAKNVLGMEGVAALMHLTGSYLYSSVLLNAADVCLPEGEKI